MKKQKGFTLIELMIVVAIIGILAAVAIPAFLRFVRKSRTSEAPLNLKGIANGAVAWFNDEHSDSAGDPVARHFPGPSTQSSAAQSATKMPANAPCGASSAGALYKKNTAQWDATPWKSLKFGITKAHYFRYTYGSSGTDQSAKMQSNAAADLDCDGSLSSYTQNVDVATSGEVQRGQIVVSNALE